MCGNFFEKILLGKILRRIRMDDVFNKRQGGFISNRDCQTILALLVSDLKVMRKKKITFLINMDIKTAYDSVWVDGLIYKLAKIGVKGKIGFWIARWLTDRTVKVRWKNFIFITKEASMRIDVPQGSVLSPFLFMVYMHDIFEVVDGSVKVVTYADDVVMYASGDDAERTPTTLQNAVERMSGAVPNGI